MDTQEQTTGVHIFIIHGEDHLEMDRTLQQICAHSGDPGMNSPNTVRMDGRSCALDEIFNSALTLPFFSPHRLLILTHLPARLVGETGRTRFTEMLDNLPPTTTIILVIPDEWDRKDWRVLTRDHFLRKWMIKNSRRISFQVKKLPTQGEMPEWIRKQVIRRGGTIPLVAARRLAEHTGCDTLAADQEIVKLLTYVNYERVIEVDDVEQLTVTDSPVDVFEMVDAVAGQDKSRSIRLLHRLFEEQDPQFIFGMVVRQFRLLILSREVLNEGGDKSRILGEGITKSEFVAGKLHGQAGLFRMDQLETIYRRLLALDEEIKTSRMSPGLALESLIADSMFSVVTYRTINPTK